MLTTHTAENNQESRANLERNRVRFNAKCLEVYRRLMAGEQMDVLGAANSGIASLPRRILDLRESGVLIDDRWEMGRKVYYIADGTANRQKFGDIL
jgi:hypothetical protein